MSWLHSVTINGLLLLWLLWLLLRLLRLLLRLLHDGIGCFDDVVVEIGYSLKHMRIAKIFCARRECWLTLWRLGRFLRGARRVGGVLSIRLRRERWCQCIRWISKMRFIELNFRYTNPVSVDVTTEHGSIGELVGSGLSGALHSVISEWPFEGVGVYVFVGMRHNTILLRLW